MKYTDAELEDLLKKLAASTRSPRGKFSAAESYPTLKNRIFGRNRYLLSKRIFAAAASVALLCLSAWLAFNYNQPITIQTVSTLAEVQTIRLPDGTSVTLNHFSSISYPERFKGDKREVSLNGEAYFEVSKDRKHPFIVQTSAIYVEVLGTHFNVEAYSNNTEVKTTLLEGSVAVYDRSNAQQMILRPNEIAIYNKEKKNLTRQNTGNAEDEIAWRRGEIIFNNLPLQEIAQELSNTFGVPIQIDDTALKGYRITAHFNHKEDLDTILSLLGESGNFNHTRKKDKIIITTKPD